MIPTVLTIAGLDPSGGAGIAADLKTATIMGCYGMSALTTVTVQHPNAVSRVAPLPSAIVAEQVQTLLDTQSIGAIKLGLLGSTENAQALIRLLGTVSIPIVLDPVQQSTTGSLLSTIDAAVFADLVALSTVITPNCAELAVLLEGIPAGRWAIDNDVAVLHTGGHTDADPIIDVLWMSSGAHRRWSHPRIDTRHTHGTGCTLSMGVACGLAKGQDLVEAAGAASQLTADLVARSAGQNIVEDNGPLLHFKRCE
jgi:hydroxymethylpyrimidine/phosphomethylpyrimidine kinase